MHRTGLKRLVRSSKKRQSAATVDTSSPATQTKASAAPRKMREARTASALQKAVRKAGCCMRPQVHEDCLTSAESSVPAKLGSKAATLAEKPPNDLAAVPAVDSSVPAKLGSGATPLPQKPSTDMCTVPATESSIPAKLGSEAAPPAEKASADLYTAPATESGAPAEPGSEAAPLAESAPPADDDGCPQGFVQGKPCPPVPCQGPPMSIHITRRKLFVA